MKVIAINRSPRKKMNTKIENQMMMIRCVALNVALILLALVAWSAEPNQSANREMLRSSPDRPSCLRFSECLPSSDCFTS